MAHEESFFFVALLLLIVLFCLHSRKWPQLWIALLATPCVVLALVANQRRTDYVALLIGIGIAWLLTFICKPRSRATLVVLMVIVGGLMAAYVAAFWRSTGSFGAPARSIVSVFYPAAGDVSSNIYRQIENFDLKYTLKMNLPFGLGFGKPFLQPARLPNILVEDPYYLYIPHNTIYWIWMRLGPLGYGALWYLFGSTIVHGSLSVRQIKDPYLQMAAIYIVALTFMQVVVAFADYQLFFYRNVIYIGILIGVLMKLPLLDREQSQPQAQIAKTAVTPAVPALIPARQGRKKL